jgi:uracil-DNA glycosylase family 4
VTDLLQALPQQLLDSVTTCHACVSMRHSHVLGAANGPSKADVMFVGEAPGRFGAGRSGVPFLGDESGRRFESLLAEAGLCRAEVFITNAVLCNPVDAQGRNRRPATSEVKRCRSFLEMQLEAVQPALVVALGQVALDALYRVEQHPLQLRRDAGRPVPWRGGTLVSLYHPGRRALVHRSDVLQREDWRRLGAMVRALQGDAVPGLSPAEAAVSNQHGTGSRVSPPASP